jgi:LuxR family maltose regulon positive regulatory protein
MLGLVSVAPTSLRAPADLLSFDPPVGSPPPRLRRGTVRRDRLVRLLVQSAEVPLVLVRAPAGYGKTTLLCQWAQRDSRPFVWRAPEPAGYGDALARAAAALDAVPGPSVLVMDDTELEGDLEAVHALIRAVPQGSQVALAARGEPALPIGGLRAQGQVIEIGSAELAMTRREAGAMLSMAGVDLEPGDLAALLRHTEGWPAALYLAALSFRGDRDPHRAVTGFAGDDRLVADYLRDEVLTQLPAAKAAFLMRTSILGTLSGPVCDAVLRSTGSGAVLRDLARAGIPLVPLDPADSEYRHHVLLGEMLRAEQRRREPSRTAELHRRAGEWHEHEGDIAPALDHAIAAGDMRDAGRRLWTIAGRRVANGHVADVQGWLGRFRPEQLSSEATLALTAATVHLADGDRDRLEHWADTAERLLAAGEESPLSAAAAVAAMRAMAARGGLASMVADATKAYELTPEDSAWRPLSCLLRGAGLHLLGEGERAVEPLEEGARRGGVVAPSAQVLCLAQLALLAVDAEDWERAALLASRARSQVQHAGLEGYATCALVYAVSALVRAHRERVEAAQEDRRHALELLTALVDGPPWYEVEARVALARATLRLGDVVGTRALLAEASRRLREVDDAPLAATWVQDCRAHADAFAISSPVGPASLTTAELRVLRMLPTHLSFREMGIRLQVSSNTIKTHAHAVYRKLDACSRSEAVVQARRMGLVDA